MGFILFYLKPKLRHFQTFSFLVTLIAKTKHGVHLMEKNKTFLAESNFIRLIDSPTRFSAFLHSCIDHIFTNMSSHIITDSGVLPRDVCFGHSPVFVDIRLNSTIKNKSYKRKVWNFKNADFDKFRTTLQNISWNEILSHDDVNWTTSIFMENIIKAAEACIPQYDITVRPKDKPWFSGDQRRLIRRRNRMFRRSLVVVRILWKKSKGYFLFSSCESVHHIVSQEKYPH